jgi:hypothetical protein
VGVAGAALVAIGVEEVMDLRAFLEQTRDAILPETIPINIKATKSTEYLLKRVTSM